MAIRVLIVDDEQPARQELCFQLEKFEEVEVVGQAGDGVEALALIETLKPHIVLLDIQMPGHTGFEVARSLIDLQANTRIIFVTAYDEYALEAFEVSAVDYLLKPVDMKRLRQSIKRVGEQIEGGPRKDSANIGIANEKLENLIQHISKNTLQPTQLAIRSGENFQLIASNDIIYASLSNGTINIVTNTLSGTANYRTLDELQGNLDPDIFWRVHRSHLVNINKVKEILPWFSRNYILKMKDAKETEIPVSRTQTKRLRDHLNL